MAFGRPLRQGTNTGQNMSELYRSALKLLSVRTKNVLVVYPEASQTITQRCRALMPISNARKWRAVPRNPQTRIHHLNTTHRTGTRLKRQHCAIPVSSFVVLRTIVAVFLYTALSREAEAMSYELTGYAVANIDSTTSANWPCCKHAHFLTSGPWCGYTVLSCWPHNTSVFLGVGHGRGRDSACRPSVWPSAIHWFHIRLTKEGCRPVWRAISRNDNRHSRRQWSCLFWIAKLAGMHFLLFEA